MAFLPLTLALALTAAAQSENTTTNAPDGQPAAASRVLTLQDCITEALKHNFDLQIERLNPDISLYALRADYGAFYDPLFSASAQYDYAKVDTSLPTTLRIASGNPEKRDRPVLVKRQSALGHELLAHQHAGPELRHS